MTINLVLKYKLQPIFRTTNYFNITKRINKLYIYY